MASVGKHICRIRTEQHLTQEELAETLFATRQAVSAWETGKALPDVETLERIAAALEVDMTEVIYGVHQSQNLRKVKRRWALIGGTIAIALAVSIFMLSYFDFFGTWIGGLSYQFDDLDYGLSFVEIPGQYSVDIDLSNPDSNIGKVLYEDASGCRIVVDSLDFDDDDYGTWRIFFRATSICGQQGGTLVTGMLERPSGKRSALLSDKNSAALTTSSDGILWTGKPAGENGLRENEKRFSYYLFHAIYSRHGTRTGCPEEIENTTVTVTLTGLTRFTTVRTS